MAVADFLPDISLELELCVQRLEERALKDC